MKTHSKLMTAGALIGVVLLTGAPASAAQRGGGGRGGQAPGAPPRGAAPGVGRAVPRPGGVPGRFFSPRFVVPFRPVGVFYPPYYYRPGFLFGAGLGYYGYGFGYYGYPYSPYSYGYPYGYWGYGPYGYPYGYAYGYAARPYGSVRIVDAPENAEVYADGYYVGIVDDFDGPIRHLNLTPGPHKIEIRPEGRPPLVFDVRIEPGRTITYHAEMRQ